MLDFWEKRFDVLVCTTIVETGLDISNANTLIVERADVLGLSQLHQLRGRVGRGRERAYAYFLYPPEKPLTETAHDRLATIAAHTDLGAGMCGRDEGPGDPRRRQPARRRAVRPHRRASASTSTSGWSARRSPTSRARAPRSCGDVKVELPVDAHLPHDYIPGERLRLEAYRKLAGGRLRGGPRGGAGRARRPLRRAADAGRATCSRWPGSAMPAPAGPASPRSRWQGNNVRFAPVELRESAAAAAAAALPGHAGQARGPYASWCRSPSTARVGGQPLRDVELLALVPRPRRGRAAGRRPAVDSEGPPMTRLDPHRRRAVAGSPLVAAAGLSGCADQRLGAAAVVDGKRISDRRPCRTSTRDYLKIVPGADPAQAQRRHPPAADPVRGHRRGGPQGRRAGQRRPGRGRSGTTCSRASAAASGLVRTLAAASSSRASCRPRTWTAGSRTSCCSSGSPPSSRPAATRPRRPRPRETSRPARPAPAKSMDIEVNPRYGTWRPEPRRRAAGERRAVQVRRPSSNGLTRADGRERPPAGPAPDLARGSRRACSPRRGLGRAALRRAASRPPTATR